MTTFRQKIGCWFHERWRAELAIGMPGLAHRFGADWRWLCNRNESLSAGDGEGVECDWELSSLLTVARVFPQMGGRLLNACLAEWPVIFGDPRPNASRPALSVILPVGGTDRIPQFRAVARSLWGQTEREIELIAVEHAVQPEFRSVCGDAVRHIHVPMKGDGEFNKSLAMNVGVSEAKGDVVMLHDADVVVPARYVEAALAVVRHGWDAVRPIRFAFFPDHAVSSEIESTSRLRTAPSIDRVMANFPGLSTIVRPEAYRQIGGHDERFEGWGGEDAEFLDRLRTVRLFKGGYAPAIHLWHTAAPKKTGERNDRLQRAIRAVDPVERIEALQMGRVS